MIRFDRICVWMFIVNFSLMMIAPLYLGLLDEMVCWGMGAFALADCIFNNNWKRYKLLGIIIGVLTFYAVISLFFRYYNTPGWILRDYVMFIKPFLPLCVMIGMVVEVTAVERSVLKYIALFNIFMCLVVVGLGVQLAQKLLIGHILVQGQVCITSILVYIWCQSVSNEGRLSRADILIIVISLIIGLYCQRSKYYGEFVVLLFLLFVYRPGFLSRISLRNIAILSLTGLVILALIWDKLSFYYLQRDFGVDEMGDNAARAALFYGMAMILTRYPLFGSGFASFGTLPSVWNYSDLYYEYNLNLVWGISPSYYDFVADTFFATLGGQFGIVGILLIVWLFVFIYKQFRGIVKIDYPKYRYEYIVGTMIILTIFIESSSGNLIFVPTGVSQLCLLGIIVSQAKQIRKTEVFRPLNPCLTEVQTN